MLKIGAVRTKFNEIMFKRIWPILRTFEQTRQHVLKLKCQRTVGVAALSSQNAGNVNLHGVFPPIPTPFNADESIAYDALEHNLQIWNTIPFTGYLVQGSNGEYTLMNAAERVDMVRRVRALVPKDKVIMAGAGCESTAATVAMARDMSAAGADCVMVVTPSYYRGRMTSQALYEHFARVADGSPAPVVLYSVPANTNIDLAVEVVVRLAEHDNVIGLKDSGGEVAKFANILEQTKQHNFSLLAGSAGYLYPSLALGCVGGVCALAAVLGPEVCSLVDLHRAGQHAHAQELQRRLVAPNGAVTKLYGVAGLKFAMDQVGLYGGPTRRPLLALDGEEQQAVLRAFTNSGFSLDRPDNGKQTAKLS